MFYEEIYDIFCDPRNVGWSKLYDYASFLEDQNDYARAIEVAESLKWYYSAPGRKVDEYDLGSLYNLLGLLYKAQNQRDKAEKYYLAAIEIRERLAKKNADAYEPDLATSYNNAGVFYSDQGQPEKAEKYYLAAMEIQKRLVKKNADTYEPALATSYNNAGIFYKDQGQPQKADKYYLDAIEIRERLVKKNADVYEPALAVSYIRYYLLKEDETYFNKAYEIAKRRQDDPRCRDIVEIVESQDRKSVV